MKIKPIGDQIQLEMEQAALGALDTSSVKTGMEWAIIKAIGPDVQSKDLKVGARVFVKAWAIDTILYDNNDYFFTSEARKGIVALVN